MRISRVERFRVCSVLTFDVIVLHTCEWFISSLCDFQSFALGAVFTTIALNSMAKPKAFIVGAGGFLGTYLVQAATDQFQVIRGERSATDPEAVDIDITDSASVDRAFAVVNPDVVVLVAAMSDIDRCEAEPERAFAVNVQGAETVARLCAKAKAKLLFTSTAAVFDGRKHGYDEQDEICPLSIYGTTKAQAEVAVRAFVPKALIIRFALAIGFARRAGTNSMLDSLSAKWKAGNPVSLSTSEFRNPIHAGSLSKIMVRLLANHQASGVYHAGASDSISRYELGRRLASSAGFSDQLVQPQTNSVPGRAPRGKDHFLLTEKLRKICGIESPTCEQEIARCF
jgi:dTDP-4-dehydrorhamnose reductase